MNINFDFNEALEQLAKAFNTTVDALYPILIRQAYVDGVTSILAFVLPIIAICIIYYIGKQTKEKADEGGRSYWEWTDEGFGFLMAIGVFAFITIFTTIFLLITAPTAFLNPEYYAIKQVLEAIRGS